VTAKILNIRLIVKKHNAETKKKYKIRSTGQS